MGLIRPGKTLRALRMCFGSRETSQHGNGNDKGEIQGAKGNSDGSRQWGFGTGWPWPSGEEGTGGVNPTGAGRIRVSVSHKGGVIPMEGGVIHTGEL